MDNRRLATMAEATRLTRAGRLADATALIQRILRNHPATEAAEGPADGAPASRSTHPHGLLLPPVQLPRLLRKPASQASAAAPLPGELINLSYRNEAGQRSYKIYVPAGLTGQPRPLIVMLHGGTQTADDLAAATLMNQLAERDTFLVAYPEQARSANTMMYWNWFQPGNQHRAAGEPSLIAGVTQHVIRDYPIEARRVYIAGFSAGGAMAAVMAATYPDLYAAAAVHSGLPYRAAHDLPSAFAAMKHGADPHAHPLATPIPLIVFHGDRDTIVHPINATCLVNQSQLAAPGAGHAATTTVGQVPDGRAYTRVVFHHASQPLIEQWTIHEAGHAWSGGSPHGSYTDPRGPDASAEIVRFFRQHAK